MVFCQKECIFQQNDVSEVRSALFEKFYDVIKRENYVNLKNIFTQLECKNDKTGFLQITFSCIISLINVLFGYINMHIPQLLRPKSGFYD